MSLNKWSLDIKALTYNDLTFFKYQNPLIILYKPVFRKRNTLEHQ